MNRRTNNNVTALQVFTGVGCTSTAQSILSDSNASGAIASASGMVRTVADNTTLQICQKANTTITPSPWTGGAITGLLTVMRLN
jgi:hypothetical protein